MLFYQVGELFQSYAVGKSRKSIADMMDIAPDYRQRRARRVSWCRWIPTRWRWATRSSSSPASACRLDGVVVSGVLPAGHRRPHRRVAAPLGAQAGERGRLGLRQHDRPAYGAGDQAVRRSPPWPASWSWWRTPAAKKAQAENFITRFARYYTPTVVVIGPAAGRDAPAAVTGDPVATWVAARPDLPRGLVPLRPGHFSVPLSFFGGIGGASRLGILVKGGNYLEALATGRTPWCSTRPAPSPNGTFEVVAVHPAPDVDAE